MVSEDIYEFCREPQLRIGRYSGNPRDFAEEAARDSEEMVDPLEIWVDESGSEYREPEFAHFIEARVTAYKKQLGPLLPKAKIWCCGQSHKDLAWRWRYQQVKRKTVNTFRKAADHATMFPFFTFACSQPTLLEWTREIDPTLFAELQGITQRGQFDLVGGCMNECDCRIPSGEAFVRQRLHGQRYYMEHFGGRLSDIEWMPDTFGFANTLPQIFLKSGTSCFFTTKMSNNDTTPFPFTYFWWESPDGSRVMSLYQWGGFHLFGMLGNRAPALRMVKSGQLLRATCESEDPAHSPLLSEDVVPDYCIYEGAGDGRSGPQGAEVAEMRKLVESGLVAGWSTAHQHFARVKACGDRLPIWADEIYYEYHRGTLTTQHLVKRLNRKYENVLGAIEILASALALSGAMPYPYQPLLKAWHAQMLMQFHDVLPGSSIPEVYDDCYDYWVRIAQATGNIQGQLLECLKTLARPGVPPQGDLGGALVFYPHAFSGVLNLVEVPWPAPGKGATPRSILDTRGATRGAVYLPPDPSEVDVLDRKPGRLLFVAPAPLPPLGTAIFGVSSAAPTLLPAEDLRITETKSTVEVSNRFLRVAVQRDTNDVSISRLDPKSGEFAVIASGNLHLFHERAPQEQCWNIQKDYRAHEVSIPPGRVRVSRTPENGVLAEVTAERETPASRLRLVVRVFAGVPAVVLELLADWHEQDATMRWEWTHETKAEYSVAESPYGFCRRKTHPMGPHDIGRWEMYGQSWVDLCPPDGAWGLAMFNEGKYGFDARDARLGLTILRGPQYPNPDTLWVRDERERRLMQDGAAPPAFADQGTSLIRFGVLLHDGHAPDAPVVNQVAHEFNQPPMALALEPTLGDMAQSPSPPPAFFTVSPPNVELTAWKRAEKMPNAYVIRLVEMGGVPESHVQLDFAPLVAKGIKCILECDLLEREGAFPWAKANPQWTKLPDGTGRCTLAVRRCEIVSLLLKT